MKPRVIVIALLLASAVHIGASARETLAPAASESIAQSQVTAETTDTLSANQPSGRLPTVAPDRLMPAFVASTPFANLDVALKAAGASFRDVVKMNLYVVGLKPELVPLIREVRARHVIRETPPASTLVGVSSLVGADWLIEIDVIAVVDA